MNKEVYVYGDTDSVRDALKMLEENGFEVKRIDVKFYSDVDVVLSHDGAGYYGKTSVERAASRLCLYAEASPNRDPRLGLLTG